MAEVEVYCAVYEEGTMFPVTIALDAEVSALQEAIADVVSTNEHEVPPRLVVLYLARKDDAWLTSDATFDLFLKQGRREDSEYVVKMIPNWRLDDDEYFTTQFQPRARAIHVLVELPKSYFLAPKLVELHDVLLRHVPMDAVPSTAPAQSNRFKGKLRATYNGNVGRGKSRCMLLDTGLPSQLVAASHVFRRQNEFITEKLMGLADIDDVRNGLLLYEPLKHAFDHFQISFIYDRSSNTFRLKTFDRALRPLRLFGKFDQTQQAILLRGKTMPKNWRSKGARFAPGTDYNIQTTFGDLEGRALSFRSVERPYKRCLNFQARLARKRAIEMQWIMPAGDDFEDFWSEGMSLAEKMEVFFANTT